MRKIPFPYKRISRSGRTPSPEYTARKAAALQSPSVFQKEIEGQIPGRLVYQDSLITALYPLGGGQLPAHLLVIPNRRIPTLNDAKAEDADLLGHMILTARDLARQEGIAETGYRLAFNTNEDAGQSAFHLHLHLLGGARTGPMVDQRWRNIQRRLNDPDLPNSFEKRILGTWSGKGKAFGMAANITMSWEPDLQNNFLLLNYRMDMRDTSNQLQVFEGKAYYQPAESAGQFRATWFDSGGEMHPVEASYDGQILTANWGTPTTKLGRTLYRFVDDTTIEIVDYIQAKDGNWKEFNRNTVVKNSP
ncbi:MAG: HIT domain-containing protein [Saprospiraceae bacterium]|nr:HIT domain-containing protein [Saprospiraceae bacterium]